MKWLEHQLTASQFAKLLKALVVVAGALMSTALVAALVLGKLQWSGRSLTLLIPTYASKYIPIIASVGEHQPTAWSSFYLALGPAMLFTPLGLYYSFKSLSAGSMFMIIYSVFAVYFSGVMVRLLLTLAPASCFLSAVGISTFLDRVSSMTRTLAVDDACQSDDNSSASATAAPATTATAAAPSVRAATRSKAGAKHSKRSEPATTTKQPTAEDDDPYAGETLAALSVRLRFAAPPNGMKTALRPREIPSAIGLLVLAVCVRSSSCVCFDVRAIDTR